MSARVVRWDYEQLAQVARAFREHADCNRQMLNRLQRQVAVLHQGDWVGEGARAFYQEMDSLVWPSLKRLVSALESAAQVIAQINQLMHQAEDEAAHLLRAEGSAIPARVAAGIDAGLAAGTGETFGEPAARAFGGAGEQAPALDGRRMNSRLRAAGLRPQRAARSPRTRAVTGLSCRGS